MNTKQPAVSAGQTRWKDAFQKHYLSDTTTRLALKKAEDAGCTQVNLFGFLYAYAVSPDMVFNTRARQRDSATDGFRGIAARLDRAGRATEKLLASPWWKGQSIAELLESFTFAIEGSVGTSAKRISVAAPFNPTLILELPATLRTQAYFLRWLDRQVRRELTSRRVGRTLYLALLFIYWEELSGNPPKWKDLATLLDAALIAAGALESKTDGDTLSKSYKSFRKRCPSLHEEIVAGLKSYVSTAHLNTSYLSWRLRSGASSSGNPN